jgi:cytochrome c5
MKLFSTIIVIVVCTILLTNCSPKLAKKTSTSAVKTEATKVPSSIISKNEPLVEGAQREDGKIAASSKYLPENITDMEYSQGEQVWRNACSSCHELYKPNSYDASNWKKIMKTMSVNAALDAQTANAVTGYLIKNAKK